MRTTHSRSLSGLILRFIVADPSNRHSVAAAASHGMLFLGGEGIVDMFVLWHQPKLDS
jgi:hypothetical protein